MVNWLNGFADFDSLRIVGTQAHIVIPWLDRGIQIPLVITRLVRVIQTPPVITRLVRVIQIMRF